MKKIYLLLISLFLGINFLFGQSNGEIKIPVPENPNVSKLSSIEFSKLNSSIGRVDINVPLYSIELEGLSLPLILNYSSGGIKVDEEASMIGLGWALNLPTIVQTVNDENDFTAKARELLEPGASNWSPGVRQLKYNKFFNEFQSYSDFPDQNLKDDNLYFYYMSRHNFPYKGKIYDVRPFQTTPSFEYPYLNIIDSNNGIDSEADFFTVNLMNGSHSFYNNYENGGSSNYLPRGLEAVSADKEVIISGGDSRFRVTDNKGTTYIFDKKIENRVYFDNFNPLVSNKSDPNLGGTSLNSIIYYPSKIISLSGEVIDIEYILDRGFGRDSYSSITYYVNDVYTANTINGIGKADGTCMGQNSVCHLQNKTTTTINNYQSSGQGDIFLPKKIKFNGNEIVFNYSKRNDIKESLVPTTSNSNKLDKIEVFDFKGNLVQKIDLINSYFDSENTDVKNNHTLPTEADKKRLRLDQININDKLFRKFVYNSTKLPSKNSYSIDYWGYYNGANFNTSYIPNPDHFRTISNTRIPGNNNNRGARFEYAKAATLSEMHYPTGGYEKYNYELNQYTTNGANRVPNWDNYNNLIEGVGLRINSIELYDNNSLAKKIEYIYEGGNLPMKISFFREYSVSTAYTSPDPQTGGRFLQLKVFNIDDSNKNNYYSNQLFTNNNQVFYKKVIKKTIDLKSSSNSYKEESFYENNNFKYANIDATQVEKNAYYPLTTERNKFKNGTLLKEVMYNNNNDTILKREYDYTNIKSELSYSIKVNGAGSLVICTDCIKSWASIGYANHSILNFYPLYIDKTIPKSLKTTEYLNSKVERTENYIYNERNLLSSKRDFYDNNQVYTDMIYSGSLLSYSTVRKNGILISFDSYDIYNKSFPVYGDTSFFTTILKHKSIKKYKGEQRTNYNMSIINIFDENHKPVEYSDNGKITTIIWGYNKQYPIAKIEGATYSEVYTYINELETSSNSNTNPLSTSSFTNIINGLPNAMVTGYIYKPLVGITQIIQPNGMTEFYKYDEFGRLIEIKNNKGEVLKTFEYNYKQP